MDIKSLRMKAFSGLMRVFVPCETLKQKLWLPLVTCLAYCIDKDLYKSFDYLREQYGSLAVPSARVSMCPYAGFCGAVAVLLALDKHKQSHCL